MYIYLLNLALLLFWAIVIKELNIKKGRSIFIVLAAVQLFLLLALRDESVGSDIIRYLNHFEQVRILSFSRIGLHKHEIGYVLFSKLISLIGLNGRIFLIIIAAIAVISIAILIKRYSKLPFLSFYLYITLGLYSFTFSGLRQTIAYSITFFSYKYIREKKLLKFCLIVILAGLFHASAFVFIFAYPLSKIKLAKKSIAGYFVSLAIIFVFRFEIMKAITNIFYKGYPTYDSGAYMIFVINLFVVVSSLLLYKSVINKDQNSNINYILVMTSLVIIALASTSSNVVRVANYYYYYIVLLVPDIIQTLKDRHIKFLILTITVVLTLLQYVYITPTSHLRIVPYKFFWQ